MGMHHMNFGAAFVIEKLQKRGWDVDYINKLIEDVVFLVKMLMKAKDADDYYMAIMTFVKFNTPDCNLFSSKCYNRLKSFFDALVNGFKLQSLEDTFSTCRDFMGKYEEVKNAPIFKKVYKFAMYALSMSLFDKVGVNFDLFRYSKLEAEAIKRKFHAGPFRPLYDGHSAVCVRTRLPMSQDWINGSYLSLWFNLREVV
jgi:hypothetical protein